ncbi:ExeM/NucH family extracellular endonuclease [Methanothrix sp.]|jgi:predicted extracellular nuclease|uniref:ExeM/NucH family extracellular endonuclease n=1 Tax=Methanothrix sp. TaxID=90426 RepID=UPI00316AE4F1
MIAAVASPSPDRGSITDGLTMIHDIQGDGLSSPLEGKEVLIEATVTGIFQGSDRLEGFFVQEEDCDIDDNILTSEGLFIYDPGRLGEKEGISIGDTVLARGDIEEYHGLTQMRLKEIKKSDRGGKESALTAHELILPLAQDSVRLCPEMERYEGMLLMLPQDLVITDIGNLSRYGELSLSPHSRLPIPTNVAQPGAPAAGIQELNRRSIIILDDGSGRRHPESYPFPKTVRCGDTIRGITGIMSYSFGNYKIEPLNISEIIISNPRPENPEPVGGRLRIASLNLENYFNGDGLGGGFPAARGARSKSEFQMQRAKILQAIADMKVDVIGLIEIENDGYGNSSAISDLNDGLNALDDGAGMQNYEFIDPGLPKLGGDLISVGFIYNRTKIRPTGRAATTPRGASLRQPPASCPDLRGDQLSGEVHPGGHPSEVQET